MILEKIQVLNKVLGNSKRVSETDFIYKCPFCKHHKPKLQVHIYLEYWRCWVCNARGRTLRGLLRKLKAPSELINKLHNKTINIKVDRKYEELSLPKEFWPMYKKHFSPEYKRALLYLKNRGIAEFDILRYNIGFCYNGPYSNMIVIPSYDENCNLNYFTCRSFIDSNINHKNPKIKKDFIGFENLINWNEPITIVEGAFDAITIKNNVTPNFGKFISKKLIKKILIKEVPEVNICLDADAIKESIKISEYFMNNGIRVKLIMLSEKDPNIIGYEKMSTLLRDTDYLNFNTLIKYKMNIR